MSERTLDPEVLNGWVGRQESLCDVLDTGQARMMQATMDRPADLRDGDPLPHLWHWIYFPTEVPLSGLGRDGHPKLGGFLPPVALPRRMWAGGRFVFKGALPLGAAIEKRSTVAKLAVKEGRSGRLCFVTVRHELMIEGDVRVEEEHDIVYRDDPRPGDLVPEPPLPPEGAEVSETITPDPVRLFRFSALTFNGHRIHYDRDYCREVEGYPGLVFHGPLTGLLLLDLAERHRGAAAVRYAFRGVSPLFDTAPFTLNGKEDGTGGMQLWATNPEGRLAMTGEAEF